jgi:hypothetical protein
MGDGGGRRIHAAAAWHILTRVCLSALATALHRAAPFLCESYPSRRRQRGQKPLAAPRYSIAVTLRRVRI